MNNFSVKHILLQRNKTTYMSTFPFIYNACKLNLSQLIYSSQVSKDIWCLSFSTVQMVSVNLTLL